MHEQQGGVAARSENGAATDGYCNSDVYGFIPELAYNRGGPGDRNGREYFSGTWDGVFTEKQSEPEIQGTGRSVRF